ncbi:MAG: AAA-like domain-containing protein [Dolichospermum sp.]
MKQEVFERIYEEELTPIQRRILHRILKGKSHTAIRGDVTVWFDRKVYAGDEYPLFQLNFSSLYNVGNPQELREFNTVEIQNLSLKHGLNWQLIQVESLNHIIGGHPFLVRLAMYHISHEEMTLEQILNKAATNEGIYSNHLDRLLKIIRDSDLTESLKRVIHSFTPVQLDPIETFQLYSIGLVIKKDNKVEPRCQLYREYFTTFL